MSRKRSLISDIYKQKKRVCLSQNTDLNGELDGKDDPALDEVPNDTKASLLYIRSIFPTEKFEHRLPPVMMKHQLYSLVKNRTVVDKQLNDLRLMGEIKIFRQGVDADEYMVVFTEDYKSHVQRVMVELSISKKVSDKFLHTVIKDCNDVSMNKNLLMNTYQFTDNEITQLVHSSVLTVRDVGSWWLSVPNAGIFMKSFTRGRKAVITMIKKCKYREILRKDLEQRKWPKLARLGLLYHIHDIIGAQLVGCIQTTSGQLIRWKE